MKSQAMTLALLGMVWSAGCGSPEAKTPPEGQASRDRQPEAVEKLKELNLSVTFVCPEAARQLQAALPNCNVQW